MFSIVDHPKVLHFFRIHYLENGLCYPRELDPNPKMSNEAISDLKRCVKQYRQIDNEIRELNKIVYDKRENRKIVEMEMSDLIKLPQFAEIDKLKIDDDNSMIKIARPGTYTKAWSLSKKELDNLLVAYFRSAASPNAEDCSKFVTEERRKMLVGKEFDFTRVIPEE